VEKGKEESDKKEESETQSRTKYKLKKRKCRLYGKSQSLLSRSVVTAVRVKNFPFGIASILIYNQGNGINS